MLLKVGADKDVNHEFEVGVTPIMVAAKFGDAATFQLVLAAGADIRHCHFNNKDCLE
jgi:ankyrin repeat protein